MNNSLHWYFLNLVLFFGYKLNQVSICKMLQPAHTFGQSIENNL